LLVGIISDTHDNLAAVEKAIKRLNEEKVDIVLHAGDYVSPFVVPKLIALNCRLIGVFGNNDGDQVLLSKSISETRNCEIRGRFAEVNASGFKIALLHGDERELLKTLTTGACFDAVVYGHYHVPVISKNGKTLIVNPGEICGYLTGKSTLSLLDTNKQEAKIIEI
jgi:putative phosphoesterase